MSDEEIKTNTKEIVNSNTPDAIMDETTGASSPDEIGDPLSEEDENTLEDGDGSIQNNVGEIDGEGAVTGKESADFLVTTDGMDQEDTGELTLGDINLPNDELGDEDENAGGKRKWFLLSAGIIFLAALSGAGVFYFTNNDTLTENNRTNEVALSLKIPRQSKLKKGRKKMISSSQRLLQKGSKPALKKSPAKLETKKTLKPINKPKPINNKDKLTDLNTKKSTPILKNRKTSTKSISPNLGSKILADGSLVLPSVTTAAFKGIPMMEDPRPLADPDTSLGETIGGGVIPRVATDGRRPWKFYGKIFRKEKTLPRISIIITGLGLSRAATTAAINNTPSDVTLAFNPYAKGVGNWVALARGVGHETLIILPMEPTDFPISDPGPFALQVDLQKTENIDRLRYILSVSMGNIGLLQMMGTRFVSSTKALEPVLKEIHSRGLLIIDNGLAKNSKITEIAATIGLPRGRNDIFLDQDASRSAIMQKLSVLEATARKNKSAIGIAQPLPNSISLIMNWAKTLDTKKLALAPISAVAKISNKSKMVVSKPNLQSTNN